MVVTNIVAYSSETPGITCTCVSSCISYSAFDYASFNLITEVQLSYFFGSLTIRFLC